MPDNNPRRVPILNDIHEAVGARAEANRRAYERAAK
jgi:hypothetical protein